MRYLFIICSLSVILASGCTHTRTIYEYKAPEIPPNLLVCEPLDEPTIITNGNLLMAYISLRSEYRVCASKVNAISEIISTISEDDNDNRSSN